MIPLTPANRKLDPNFPKFGIVDIEALRWKEFIVLGYYYKDDAHGQTLEIFEEMSEFAAWVFEDAQKAEQIFAHFGGKYDFNFLLKAFCEEHQTYFVTDMINRGSGLLCFTAHKYEVMSHIPKGANKKQILGKTRDGRFMISRRAVQFRDSSALLAFGLKTLTKNFGVEHEKEDFDFDDFNNRMKDKTLEEAIKEMKRTKEWDRMIHYLTHDLIGLHEVMEAYFRQPMIAQSGAAYTMAGQALKVFQTYLGSTIPSVTGELDEFIRSAYFGGRTEIFKPFFEQEDEYKPLKVFDVNSLYPYVMKDLDFPGGPWFSTSKYLDNKMGFYDVTVHVPDHFYIPPLGTVWEPDRWGKFIFPTGTFRGKWSTLELNYALSLGCKILKVHRGEIMRSQGPIFKDYINHLYSLRKAAKKNSVDDIVYKLLMNSLYGRFGLNLEREKLVLEEHSLGLMPNITIELDDGSSIGFVKIPHTIENSFVNVGIAAWVTSGARIHMHKQFMKDPSKIWYTDTDSLFTTLDFDNDAKELGALKKESTLKRACFLLPKTYMAESHYPEFSAGDQLSVIKMTMKGFDKKKIRHFTLDDFKACLEGELRLKASSPEKFATLKTALQRRKFLDIIKESPREIRSKYDKRRLFKRYGQWDSEPLHIRDEKIVNLPDTDSVKFLRKLYLESERLKGSS